MKPAELLSRDQMSWRYGSSGRVKHAFRPEAQHPLCGARLISLDRRVPMWLEHPAVLRRRRECRVCAARLESR